MQLVPLTVSVNVTFWLDDTGLGEIDKAIGTVCETEVVGVGVAAPTLGVGVGVAAPRGGGGGGAYRD